MIWYNSPFKGLSVCDVKTRWTFQLYTECTFRIKRGVFFFKEMGVREFCHFFAALHFWFGCYYDWNYVILPQDLKRMNDSVFSSKLKFLTYWNAVSSWIILLKLCREQFLILSSMLIWSQIWIVYKKSFSIIEWLYVLFINNSDSGPHESCPLRLPLV